MIEAWRTVVGFSAYAVSDHGRVKRALPGHSTKVGRILTATAKTGGYLQVSLHRDGKQFYRWVHELVLTAFVGSSTEQARHRDGDRQNNKLSNLQWGTAKQNASDRDGHGMTARGERNGWAKITEDVVRQIREKYVPYSKEANLKTLAQQFGLSPRHVLTIVRGTVWAHVGNQGG